MRLAMTMAATGVLAGLAACTAPRQVDSTPPTVSYSFERRADYDEVAQRADRYCVERYGANAYLVDRRQVSGGYEAVFACE